MAGYTTIFTEVTSSAKAGDKITITTEALEIGNDCLIRTRYTRKYSSNFMTRLLGIKDKLAITMTLLYVENLNIRELKQRTK